VDLQEREVKIRRLINTDVIGILQGNLEGRIIDANEAFLQMVGYNREDLASGGLRWTDLTPVEWCEQDERLSAELKVTGFLRPFEKEFLRKDGTRVPVLISTAMFEGSSTEGVACVLDLTERKRAEKERERLRQLEADLAHINRVSMMGELAASLAHEMKQPMAATATNAGTCVRWLQRQPPDIEEAREAPSRVLSDVNRGADIISRMRSLFTKDVQQRELLDVNGAIEEIVVLLRGEAKRYSIPIRSDLARDLPKIMADHVQLQQVLMNHMLNSIEAMKDLTPPGEVTISSRREDTQLVISVSDTGVGLPPGEADQIFTHSLPLNLGALAWG
jgi:PAS domain S-box-containing protein